MVCRRQKNIKIVFQKIKIEQNWRSLCVRNVFWIYRPFLFIYLATRDCGNWMNTVSSRGVGLINARFLLGRRVAGEGALTTVLRYDESTGCGNVQWSRDTRRTARSSTKFGNESRRLVWHEPGTTLIRFITVRHDLVHSRGWYACTCAPSSRWRGPF